MLERPEAEDTDATGLQVLDCGPRLSHAMKTYCRRRRISYFMMLTAALAALFHAHAGRERLALWVGLSNRRAMPGAEGLIGWLAESRLVGAQVGRLTTFDALVSAMRSAVLEASADEHLPLAAIRHTSYYRGRQRALYGRRAIRVQPEIPNVDESIVVAVSQGLSMRWMRVPHASAENLVKIVVAHEPRAALSCSYARRRVSDAGVRGLLRQLRGLIEKCLEEPTRDVETAGAAAVRRHGK